MMAAGPPHRRRFIASVFFATPDAFRAWLDGRHASPPAVGVGFPKTGSGRPSLA
ncbi:MAG: hypothetical protein IT337_07465 [Thermomicrobiales bacterium]|nr:hypothetical protein [Thermomicrobiales bacterium]